MNSDPTLTIGIAAIAALAALTGAVIAAWTAGRRQKRQLAHESQRQQRQLRHDRELADLSELRALLDECAVMLAASFYSYANAIASIDGVERMEASTKMLEQQGAPDFIVREAIEAVVEAKRAPEVATAKVMDAQALGERISIRLDDDVLRGHYDSAVRALFVGTQHFPAAGRQSSAQQRSIYEGAGGAFEAARLAFSSVSRELVGSRIEPRGTSVSEG